ncbi:MAG TPA: tRNA lysidine(34) synthetase TilS [Hyphomicrobiaceae bacterium]|nr:tRNA lysidine(34) synthetase TilS [Hyphomicrobiaceae bacterium]
MTSVDLSIERARLDGLFGDLIGKAAAGVALAVSGGSDSTALMVLFAEWLARSGRTPTEVFVLTVDHGLRPQSRAEAEWVAQMAAGLGFRHAILPWTGPKPKTGVQAAARAARYRLLAQFMGTTGLSVLVTAHTADDQAETLLMRLARGSGLDGLAAMAPRAPLDAPTPGLERDMVLARPLLGIAKAALTAALEARGVPWLDDASNSALVFERSRWRAAGDTLARLGLKRDSLALSARRLQRARAALDWALAEFCAAAAGRYRVDPCGFISIDGEAWRALPSELKLRVLARGIAAAGGAGHPLPLAKLEALADRLARSTAGRWTLARTAVRAAPGTIVLEREPGRRPCPELALAPGQRGLWDGRFWVAAGPELGFSVAVRALGPAGLAALRRQVPLPVAVPAGSLRALPGFWTEAKLFAVPSLAFPQVGGLVSATFAPLAGPAEGRVGDRWEGSSGPVGP